MAQTDQKSLNERATSGRKNKRHRQGSKRREEIAIPEAPGAGFYDKSAVLARDACVRVVDQNGQRRMISTRDAFVRELLLRQPAIFETHKKARNVVFVLDDRLTEAETNYILAQEFEFMSSGPSRKGGTNP